MAMNIDSQMADSGGGISSYYEIENSNFLQPGGKVEKRTSATLPSDITGITKYPSTYYTMVAYGGTNKACAGDYADIASTVASETKKKIKEQGWVLPNCVGYAVGRFCEISRRRSASMMTYVGDAKNFYSEYRKIKYNGTNYFKVGSTPKLGAIACWGESTKHPHGHVAIVEEIDKYNNIKCSESWYSEGIRTKTQLGGLAACVWLTGEIKANKNYQYPQGKDMPFLGFIYNPYINDDGYWLTSNGVSGGSSSGTGPAEESQAKEIIEHKWVTTTKTELKSVENFSVGDTRASSLLTSSAMVQAPFVIVKIGEYTFGTYNEYATADHTKKLIKYPNYVQSLDVKKINNALNQYTIGITYQVRDGDDPNFIDKVLSSVGYGKIYLRYGDWMLPNFIYGEEEAIITGVKTSINFSSSQMTYTISATSTALKSVGSTFNFDEQKNTKPSTVIINVLRDQKYGLNQILTGMNASNYSTLIATNDKPVDIPAKTDIDVLSYINYLTTFMASNESTITTQDSVVRDSSYYLTVHDDAYGEYGGPFIKVEQVIADNGTISNENIYEVDIGYPTDNSVINFTVNNDNAWSLLYDYSMQQDELNANLYKYNIDKSGNFVATYSPSCATSTIKHTVTEAQKTWWTKMTRFSIQATLTLKGLLRPVLLMTKVRVNSFFYGNRHISSGLYIITEQHDKISASGYQTTLQLTRIAGDTDYFKTSTETQLVTYKKTPISGDDNSSNTLPSTIELDEDIYVKNLKLLYKYFIPKGNVLYYSGDWKNEIKYEYNYYFNEYAPYFSTNDSFSMNYMSMDNLIMIKDAESTDKGVLVTFATSVHKISELRTNDVQSELTVKLGGKNKVVTSAQTR